MMQSGSLVKLLQHSEAISFMGAWDGNIDFSFYVFLCHWPYRSYIGLDIVDPISATIYGERNAIVNT